MAFTTTASGLQYEDTVVGGGVEAMSRVPMGSDGGAWPVDPSSAFATYFVPQGVSADMIASKWGFSRADVDAYSVESHKRAAQSWAEGRFKKSVVPVKNQLGLIQPGQHGLEHLGVAADAPLGVGQWRGKCGQPGEAVLVLDMLPEESAVALAQRQPL